MRKSLRYFILLSILLFVAVNEAWIKERSTSWEHPLWVQIYALSGDNRAATDAYIASLTTRHFKPIEKFVNREARRFGITIDAIDVEYRGRLQSHPPQPPTGQSAFDNILWSLKFRAWAWYRAWTSSSSEADIELFVSYYDSATTNKLHHSVGLQGGLIGIINGFAEKSYRGSNHVVIIHELMHTLGARDKYGAANMPMHPEGYAEPFRKPLLPQVKAEIMGAQIPLSRHESRMPESLAEVVVGPITAAEINWAGGK